MKSIHKDPYNIVSAIFLIIGFISSYIIINYFLKVEENTFVNRIGIISSVLSFVGFLITFLQLLKIKSNAVVQNLAVNSILQKIKLDSFNSSIDNASNQITLIKKLIELKKIKDVSGNLEFLRYNLSVLISLGELGEDQVLFLTEIIRETKGIETKAIFSQSSNDELTNFFGQLIDLQSVINKIKATSK